ncbi:uncharacterized protein RJT21DRAFT_123443 [Scheffersomyces amazonensis]|uniref:uncharacterized protein n=1 Tax=Scheffersomyces amazonensis TaxID=1078765 RepID=UPI00315E010B
MTTYSKDLENNTKLQQFITNFYKISDLKPPTENDPYLNFVSESPTIVMGSNKFEGRANIAAMRKGMWTFVTHRHHVPQNVSTVVEDKRYLVNGYVEYTLTNGKQLSTDWAAYIEFGEGLELKLNYYQVYLDTAPMKAAVLELRG